MTISALTVGDWTLNTTDQIGNVYTGPLAPRTEYPVTLIATGTNGRVAEATTSFRTRRRDTPSTGEWITDGSYRTPSKFSPTPMVFRRRVHVRPGPARAFLRGGHWCPACARDTMQYFHSSATQHLPRPSGDAPATCHVHDGELIAAPPLNGVRCSAVPLPTMESQMPLIAPLCRRLEPHGRRRHVLVRALEGCVR